jgi:hypothetical protein
MEGVRDDDTDDVDVGRGGDGLPTGLRPVVAEALGSIGGERGVDVGDGDEPDLRQACVVQRGRRPVAGSVRAARHAGSDDRHTDR